jgi:diadenosine tetraphosphatase ApaH/serine/threonine PP2A family protein phosphatase
VDPAFRSWFNPNSLRVLDLTREMLSEADVAMLKTWPRTLVRHGCRYVHGCPPDSVSEYLYEYEDGGLGELCASFSEPVCFIGHTHELQLVRCLEPEPDHEIITPGRYSLDRGRCIVNIGSVGQPRDGDSRAKYVLFDVKSREIEVRAVRYDIRATADLIVAFGFPETYARRLW